MRDFETILMALVNGFFVKGPALDPDIVFSVCVCVWQGLVCAK